MRGELRRRLAAIPLGARLILYFALLISVPLLSVSVASQRLFSGFIEDLVVRQKRELGELTLEQVELLRQRDERSSDEILFSRAVQERLLARPFATGLERYTAKRVFEPVLAGIEEANGSVGVLVVAADGEVYRSNESLGRGPDLPYLAEILGHPRLAASRGANVWIPLGRDALRVMPDDTGRAVPVPRAPVERPLPRPADPGVLDHPVLHRTVRLDPRPCRGRPGRVVRARRRRGHGAVGLAGSTGRGRRPRRGAARPGQPRTGRRPPALDRR